VFHLLIFKDLQYTAESTPDQWFLSLRWWHYHWIFKTYTWDTCRKACNSLYIFYCGIL